MKVLITGVSGLLGSEVARHFSLDENLEVFGLSRKVDFDGKRPSVVYRPVDITNHLAIKSALEDIKPDIIIHCAANVNLLDCEKNKDYAHALHVESTKILANSAGLSKFIYISTDSVFDGNEGDYSENSPTNPLNYYAKSKLDGEYVAMNTCDNTAVLRTNIYGINYPLKNSLAEWAIKNIIENKILNGFTDVHFNPVHVRQLAHTIVKVIEHDYVGILNVGASSNISKFDFIAQIAQLFDKSKDLIIAKSISEFPSEVTRPLNTTLNVSKLRSSLKVELSLIEGLEYLLETYKSDK